MKGQKRVLMTLGLVALLAVGCGVPSDAAGLTPPAASPVPSATVAPPQPQDQELDDPGEVVEAFYSRYLSYKGHALADRAYADHPAVAADLVETVDALLASFDKGGYDPFLCAQDRPNKVDIASVNVNGNRAELRMTSDLADHAFDVMLQVIDGRWQIVDVECGSADEGTAPVIATPTTPPSTSDEGFDVTAPVRSIEDGTLIADETYGFAVQIPAGWTYEDVVLDDPNQPPIGNMDRLTHLIPPDWTEDFIALQFEVYEMDDETFAREFMRGMTSEAIVRDDGLAYVKHTHVFGQARMYQTVFQYTDRPEVRVVFTDYTTGWPDRLAGHEDVAEQFDLILASFVFTN